MPKVNVISSNGTLVGADEKAKIWIAGHLNGTTLTVTGAKHKETRMEFLNNKSHAIYREAAKLKGDTHADDEKAYCKYRHGIPVLINDPDDGDECRDYYERLLKGLSYEERIERMKDSHRFYIPVTSLMTDLQMSAYLKRVLQDYAQNQGLVILTPKERQQLENYEETRK